MESGGLPPFRDKTAEGWGTHFSGGERVGHPPHNECERKLFCKLDNGGCWWTD
jgi:hypothetical protein